MSEFLFTPSEKVDLTYVSAQNRVIDRLEMLRHYLDMLDSEMANESVAQTVESQERLRVSVGDAHCEMAKLSMAVSELQSVRSIPAADGELVSRLEQSRESCVEASDD